VKIQPQWVVTPGKQTNWDYLMIIGPIMIVELLEK
jgi:hypothetical protein